MERMVESWEVSANAVHKMQQDVARIESNMRSLEAQVNAMNYNVERINNRMTPQGMMRGMMPW